MLKIKFKNNINKIILSFVLALNYMHAHIDSVFADRKTIVVDEKSDEKTAVKPVSEWLSRDIIPEKPENSFFYLCSRMRYINRWGILKNFKNESLEEHSCETAIIAHALVVRHNIDNPDKQLNADRAATLALYHDVTEIVTGDMPTPVKYCLPDMKLLYKDIEKQAAEEMFQGLPNDMKKSYESLLLQNDEKDAELLLFVKAADVLSAITKCLREKNDGNKEFGKPYKSLLKKIIDLNNPSADYYIKTFLPSFGLDVEEYEKISAEATHGAR